MSFICIIVQSSSNIKLYGFVPQPWHPCLTNHHQHQDHYIYLQMPLNIQGGFTKIWDLKWMIIFWVHFLSSLHAAVNAILPQEYLHMWNYNSLLIHPTKKETLSCLFACFAVINTIIYVILAFALTKGLRGTSLCISRQKKNKCREL